MKITVTGSLGNISRILIEKLVSKGHEVKVISSNPARAKEIEQRNAIALIGSIEDYDFVKSAFEHSDAVYLMIPPNFKSPDPKQSIKKAGDLYAKAIQQTGVEFAVNLSSLGSHLENGLGPTSANFCVEQKLNGLQNVNVLHLRPAMFMTNFYGSIPLIKAHNMLGSNFDGTVIIPLSHPKDIADAAFKALDHLSISGKQIQYIVGDEKSGFEIAQILGNAISNHDVKWTTFSDEQLLSALVRDGIPEQIAKVYIVEIGSALQNGHIMEDYQLNKDQSKGGTTFQDFSTEFAMAYQMQKQ